jgi:hypothetical protein
MVLSRNHQKISENLLDEEWKLQIAINTAKNSDLFEENISLIFYIL